MRFLLRARIRHPFFPRLKPTPAAEAHGLCEVLAGDFGDLLDAASRGARARRAVWVLNAIEEEHRAALWERFQVPVLALLLNSAGSVVAYECEAQEGLHVQAGFAGDVTHEECSCGRPGPRIAALEKAPA